MECARRMMMLHALLFVPAVVGINPGVATGLGVKANVAALPAGLQRSWVDIPKRRVDPWPQGAEQLDEAAAVDRRIRILSYNVLGARQGLTKKHDHVGLDIRNWSTRRDRLREEIWSYHKAKPGGVHVICLQEVTFRTLGDTWLPFMAKLGLDRHVYQPKSDRPQKRHRSRCLGVAIFYSSKHFEKTADLRVVFSEEAQGLREGGGDRELQRPDSSSASEVLEAGAAAAAASTATAKRAGKRAAAPSDQFLRRVYGGDTGRGKDGGRKDPATASHLEQDLADKHDAAALVRLRLKESGDFGAEGAGGSSGGGGGGGGGKNERSVTIVCAHLFYDPRRPDLKTAQCQMLFQAVDRFHKKCGVAGDLGGGETGGEGSSPGPVNLIMCADFNSKPVMDPWFLPGPLKAAAEAELRSTAPGTPRDHSTPIPGRLPNTSEDKYPSSQATASGVYSLLSYGCVPPTHPEHPDAFIPEFVRLKEQEEVLERERLAEGGTRKWTPQRPRRAGDPPVVLAAAHRPSGEWISGFGAALEDVYRERGAVSPCFTTKTSSFSGVIDHMFVSTGEKGSGLAISGVLAFPPGAHLTEERDSASKGIEPEHREKKASPAELLDRQDQNTPTDGPASGGFGPIPNELWGSDHMALGVELVLL